jgi:hypothetical protein
MLLLFVTFLGPELTKAVEYILMRVDCGVSKEVLV